MPKKQFEQFRAYAENHHANQMYGDSPYITHLDRVTAIINKHAGCHDLLPTLQFCAIGHDLIEDTTATLESIKSYTNATAAQAILLISDPDAPDRSLRKKLAYKQFEEYNDEQVKSVAATIKLADRLDNMTSCLKDLSNGLPQRKAKMYLDEHQDFMSVFEKHCLFSNLVDDVKNIHHQIFSTLQITNA
ncbi:hypothetical protein [Photobacterium damselae]|uniref:hypothetical protein n=1 Tax=Photobacterium damselae TaxID=38293 RepID=UPI001F3C01C9|nr:hypothetical protein [Photobacterium damselae]UKA04936.1 hypothetical protein IHC89_22080 [Photobacterium damselae subsp. damselae]